MSDWSRFQRWAGCSSKRKTPRSYQESNSLPYLRYWPITINTTPLIHHHYYHKKKSTKRYQKNSLWLHHNFQNITSVPYQHMISHCECSAQLCQWRNRNQTFQSYHLLHHQCLYCHFLHSRLDCHFFIKISRPSFKIPSYSMVFTYTCVSKLLF